MLNTCTPGLNTLIVSHWKLLQINAHCGFKAYLKYLYIEYFIIFLYYFFDICFCDYQNLYSSCILS